MAILNKCSEYCYSVAVSVECQHSSELLEQVWKVLPCYCNLKWQTKVVNFILRLSHVVDYMEIGFSCLCFTSKNNTFIEIIIRNQITLC